MWDGTMTEPLEVSAARERDEQVRGPTWVEVDLDAVERNVRRVRAWVGRAVGVFAVVKADAYGLGALPVARAALAGGASGLAVARVSEGRALRAAGIEAKILVLTGVPTEELAEAVEAELALSLADRAPLPALRVAAYRAGKRAVVHLALDTGLTRYGGDPNEIEALAEAIASDPAIRLDGLYTHFASADETDGFLEEQLARFHRVRLRLERLGHVIPHYHAANTAATLRIPAAHLDLVRLGIGLYGAGVGAADPAAPRLELAVQLRARVLRVMEVSEGTTVGYGRTFRCPGPTRLALVGAGFADGVPRALSNRGVVLIGGQRAPLVGRVSMDQCVADVTALGAVEPGDEAVFYGVQGNTSLSPDEVAQAADTNVHELFCRIGARVPRIYRRQARPDSLSTGHEASAAPWSWDRLPRVVAEPLERPLSARVEAELAS